jgi:DNA-binding NarL/FixJ family response regulator
MTQPNSPDPNHLSKQEREILQQVAEGKPNRDIADELCLSPHTIKNHKANIMKKLGLKTTAALLRYAWEWAQQKAKDIKGRGGKTLIISVF